jgi:hypothetical protein
MSKSSKEINAELRKASISAGTDSPPPDPKAKAKEIEKARKKSTMTPVMISGASPSVSAGSGQTKPLPSIAGVQFDAYEKSFTAKSLSKDPHQILVTWPQDDIVVEDQKRKMRTAKPYLPSDLRQNEASYINTLTTMFQKPWRVVSRPHLAEGLNSGLTDDYQLLPDIPYEVDRLTPEAADNSENKIEKSTILVQYVDEKRDAEAIRKDTKSELKAARETLMLTVPMELVLDSVDPRPHGKMLTDELIGMQILVEPTELSFDLGVHEPFFVSIALYDLKRREKVSETWNFDLNPPSITELLGVHCGDREPATLAKSCIFSTSYQSPDIYMVIIVSTTLHGEESEAIAPYLNSKIKDKDKEKFIQEARLSTQRLGGYRQPFGYSVLQMFDDSHVLRLTKDNVVSSLMRPKYERDVYSLIEKFLASSGKSKSSIPCKFAFNAKKISDKDHVRGRLTSCLQPVKPLAKGADSKLIREMGDFSASSPEGALRHMPNLAYENVMYLLPESVNFHHVSSTSSRNIAIEVRLFADDQDLNGPGLPLIYGDSVNSAFTKYARSHVFYHSKKPVFFDEIKIQLPTFLTSKHHLLVTFSHLTCALQKGKPNATIETLIGKAIIPIYPDNRLIRDGRYSMPVAVNLPNEGYMAENPDVTNPTNPVKWIDNGKQVFAFRLKTSSTIYPQDAALDEFFKQYEAYKPSSDQEDPKLLIASINGLAKAEKQKVIEYFPVVFNLLFKVMSNSSTMTQTAAFLSIMNIVDTVHSNSFTNNLLDSYVQYIFDNQMTPASASSKSTLCEVLVEIWFYQILVTKSPLDGVIRYAGFLFQLIFKSMVLMLHDTGELKEENRKERFSNSLTPLLHKLVTQLAIKTKELCSTSHSPEGRKLYQKLALFLRDLFSIMDRGSVFEMIHRYVFELDPDNDASSYLLECKFQFLRIICNHEQFIPLNLPIADDLTGISVTDIKTVYWKRHFLAGLLLEEVGKCMAKPTSDRRAAAVTVFRDLLWKHDHDPRYRDPAMRERIAQIYFPFLLMVIDHWPYMQEYATSYSFNERRCWFVCFIWVLKNVNRNLLQTWWKRDTTPKRKKAFLDIMADCILHFEYVGAADINKPREHSESQSLLNTTGLVGDGLSASTDSTGGSGAEDRKRRKHAKVRKPNLSLGGSISTLPLGFDPKAALASYYTSRVHGSIEIIKREDTTQSVLTPAAVLKKEQNLGREVAMTIIDVMMDFANDHRNELVKKENVEVDKFEPEKLFEKTFNIFIRVLQCNQAKSVVTAMMNQFQWIIPKFRTPLFRYRSSVCGALTFEVVKHLNSKIASIRALASGALLLMIKHNYEEVKNFSRMKLQSSVAISQLFATPALDHGPDGLKDALNAIRFHALARFNKEKTKHGTLGTEVKELVARLEHVIEDNLKMEEYSFDPETKSDLYHQISRGYADSPDLRMTELEKLAQMHHRDGNMEECAMVRITQAIFVSEYLRLLNRTGTTEAMVTNATQVFPNLLSEITLPKKQELETLEAEICQSKTFTEEGFVMLLAQAVAKLKDQMLFESCVEVYRLLLPIYQFRRNYQRQADCYEDLHKLCIASVEQTQTNNRIFARYYRVAFFGGGEKLQELDGQQYIYKENGAVLIDGITDRLRDQFSAKISKDNIHFVSNITNFERSSMQIGHLYIQLVSVTPYIPPEEIESKPTLFQQHFNVSTFIYETPFYKGDKDVLSNVWKKKTILTVDGAFPCVKKRLPIKNVQTLELTPIENATEMIQQKTASLQSELTRSPVNTKTLQRELQGTLLLQVNAGPAAVASEFLSGSSATKPTAAQKDKLCQAFIHFVKLLAEGVAANNALITVEQLTLQRELVAGYFRLKALVCKLTNTAEDAIEQNFSQELAEPLTPSSSDFPDRIPSSPVSSERLKTE